MSTVFHSLVALTVLTVITGLVLASGVDAAAASDRDRDRDISSSFKRPHQRFHSMASEASCSSVVLSGLEVAYIPFYWTYVFPLALYAIPSGATGFNPAVKNYTAVRANWRDTAFFRINATNNIPGSSMSYYLNGLPLDPAVVDSGVPVDRLALQGTNLVSFKLSTSDCNIEYHVTVNTEPPQIYEPEFSIPPCSRGAGNYSITATTISVSVSAPGSNMLVPLTISPPFKFNGSIDPSQYVTTTPGNFTGGTLHLTITNYTTDGWIRYKFNHGLFQYTHKNVFEGEPQGVDLALSPLVETNSNIVQLDIIDPFRCGGTIHPLFTLTVQQGDSPPLPPPPHTYLNVSQLSGEFWNWAASFAPSPLLGSYTQNDPKCNGLRHTQGVDVYFLGGTHGGNASRTCTAPARTPIYFPVINHFCSSVSDSPVYTTPTPYTECANRHLEGLDFQKLVEYRYATLDHYPLSIIYVESGDFIFFVATNHSQWTFRGEGFLNDFSPIPISHGPAADTGYYVYIPTGLNEGQHEITFGAKSGEFILNVNYTLLVV
jgi:hypothetical protein